MKMKSLARTANCAWSPEEVHSGIFLAAGTAAQQVDASFNTSSQLELLSLDAASSDKELKPIAQAPCELRFHKIVWGALGIQQNTAPSGILCGGTNNCTVQLFSVQRLLDGEPPLLAAYRNHSGPVRALDLNPFQHNLLASGSRDSEIFIWDLSSLSAQPYTPGTPCQPLEDVASLSWNRQVEHILASALSTRCVVWDLRKSEAIIRVGESSPRFRCKAVAWNPQVGLVAVLLPLTSTVRSIEVTVATQLCLASEDDHTPWLQIWDLRYASSPVKTLEKHRKGVLAINWNPKDEDMLVSCGKDSSVCIWNPNGAQGSELISEIHTSSDWNFEVQWCPRNPGLVSTASFSGELAVYSVIGGDAGGCGDGGLKKAPSWLSGGVGAQFGFGGKLITFSKGAGANVDVIQLVTDNELISRVNRMDEALLKGTTYEERAENAKVSAFWESKLEGEDGLLWKFIDALHSSDSTRQVQDLLGFPSDAQTGDATEDLASAFDQTVQMNGGSCVSDTTSAGRISRALVSGDVRKSVELCLRSRRFTEALFLADYAQDVSLKESVRKEFLNAHRADSMCRLVACVSSGLWEELAELAPPSEWQTTLAAVLGHVTGDNQRTLGLCATVADKLASAGRREDAMLAYVLAKDLDKLAESYLIIRGAPNSSERLQTFMELMTAARLVTGAHHLPKPIAPLVAEYVGLLAEHGCLPTTLHYLNDLDTQDAKVVQLRDRILQSQGMTDSYSQHRQQSRAQTHSGGLASTGYPGPGQSYPGYPDVNSNLPTAAGQKPSLGPQEISPPSGERAARPLSRAGKYPAVVDPSIKNSGAGYGVYSAPYNPTVQDPYVGYPSVGAPQYDSYLHSRSTTPAVDSYGAQYPAGLTGRPAFDGGMTAPAPVLQAAPMVPAAPTSPPLNLPSGNDYTRDERYTAPGWNDPPPLRRSSKQLPNPAVIPETTCSPLTTPLPGAPASTSVPGTDTFGYYSPQQTSYQMQAAGAPASLQSQHQQTTYTSAVQPPPAPATASVEKPPIPQEYQTLFDTFNRLRMACQGVQNNLVQKKMEDVSRKIEHLGDKLRHSELSDATISSLQGIAEAIANQNYAYALQVFAYLAQTSNLTETSAFLPGIKTLLTVAQQHQLCA
ncbi:protein transport protein Sec31A-like [Tropilaelaps mercedesae]|uniref:Protein transport protein Sec31A-like n=1 Tax=Tropilaelaps mercedesae TaxID=418985 RepID=A0A1V9XEQ9_9ACAR|nr:protein transport protein Sec31A-like [Tropilaelaps mercedesae]